MNKKILIIKIILAVLWLIFGIITIVTKSANELTFGCVLVCYIVEMTCSIVKEWK